MEAQTQEAPRRCDGCSTENAASSRYCKQCGASFAAPPVCPACKSDLPKEARFCQGCGLKVVGMRPIREAVATDAARPAPAAATSAVTPDSPPPPASAAQAELKALTDNMPKAQPTGRSSNMLGNVLMLVAVLSVFVVIMYLVNKDAPKEISPFEGGPPPMKGAEQKPAQQQQAQPAQGGASAGAPISGTIKIAPDLAASAPAGTVYLYVRNAGMPGGPPLAAKQFKSPSYPIQFEVGPSDMMQQGLAFEGPYDLHVRLDQDGNAMTKEPGDLMLSTPKAKVMAGEKNVELVLDKRL